MVLVIGQIHVSAGAKSAHILVYDRREQRVIEETISPYMVLAMRNMYQTPVGRLMIGSGAHKALLDLTRREGRYMNSPASIKVCVHLSVPARLWRVTVGDLGHIAGRHLMKVKTQSMWFLEKSTASHSQGLWFQP